MKNNLICHNGFAKYVCNIYSILRCSGEMDIYPYLVFFQIFPFYKFLTDTSTLKLMRSSADKRCHRVSNLWAKIKSPSGSKANRSQYTNPDVRVFMAAIDLHIAGKYSVMTEVTPHKATCIYFSAVWND